MSYRAAVAVLLALGVAGCASGASISALGTNIAEATASAAGTPTDKSTFDPFGTNDDTDFGRRNVIEKPTLADVLQPGPLPENSYGKPDAPVVVIKYASLTCPYCRQFHLKTFPVFKREYIDTGKVRFILREFPIGFQSGTATVAWRCAPKAKRLDLYSRFLNQQSRWVSQEVRRPPIYAIARQVGVTKAQLDACYEDKTLVNALKVIKERGRTLGIIGTPNFFINNRLEKRVLTIRDLREIIDPLVAAGGAQARRTKTL
ncbi:MAG: DsbA family protein [Pseudomonadota bacterium]